MSAFSSETLRLRTAVKKLAKWLSPWPAKVRTSLPSKSNRDSPAMIPSVPKKIQPPFKIRVERLRLQSARLRHDSLVAEIVNDHLGVGGFRGVGVTEASAVAEDGAAQSGDAEAQRQMSTE